MMQLIRLTITMLLAAPLLTCTAASAGEMEEAEREPRFNVLLIAVDDLRPALGCYGDRRAHTPSLDRLAGEAVVFERAYCQYPSCCPSRTSLLTGLRPDSTGVVSNGSPHFRRFLSECVTLPQRFREHGYFCKELGKVFHRRDPASWSEPKWAPPADFAYPIYGTAEVLRRQKQVKATRKPDDWWGAARWAKAVSHESPQISDEALFDGQLADEAIATLKRCQDRPFFLAVGFFRPHLPFVAPQKYFDLHPPQALKLPEHRRPPHGCPDFAVHGSPELRTYTDIPRGGRLDEELQLKLLRAYYASVSYVDAQIGRVLDALDQCGLANRTVVVLWGDHGYQLGEHGMWNKHTNFEAAVHAPLVVRAPGFEPARTQRLVELVDIYPTLCELCQIDNPEGLEGVSFVPLMRNPQRKWKAAAFSQAAPRGVMGHSLRTSRYRYVEWRREDQVIAQELYDLEQDPAETVNLAQEPDQREVVRRLAERLNAGWRAARPK